VTEPTAKALVVALELLRRAVVDQTTAALLSAKATTDAATGRVPGWATAAANKNAAPGAGKPPMGGPRPAEPDSGRDRSKGFGGVASLLVGLFGKLLVPIVSLASVLGQASSGFGLFTKAINVFASAVAPILLPVFAVLAAAVVAVSDEIWNALLPNLRDWYNWILANAVPVFNELVSAVRTVIDSFRDAAAIFGLIARKPTGPAQLQPGLTASTPEQRRERQKRLTDDAYRPEGFDGWDKNKQGEWFMERDRERRGEALHWLRTRNQERAAGRAAPDQAAPHLQRVLDADPSIAEEARRDPWGRDERGNSNDPSNRPLPAPGDVGRGGAPPAGGQPGGAARGGQKTTFEGALRDVVRSLQMSVGPKASYTALSEVGKQAQLTALNQDPLDAKVLRRTLDSLQELLKAIADNTGKQAQGGPVFPTGRP
jgi:hypothetical protein